ncbi:MAG: hypothetical protein HY392_00410 [Candidatus Diapherotrites archaeon]|nr:hypothetical protein [Candidatus Diapherotrites archaeon]
MKKENGIKYKKEIIGFALLFASMVAWSFFLNASGLTIEKMIGLTGFDEFFATIFNLNFAIFLVLFPLSIALVSAYTKAFEKKSLYIIVFASSMVFLGLAMVLYRNAPQFLVTGIVYAAALLFGVEASFVKFSELKTLPFLRTSMATAGLVGTFVAIGLFASTALFVLPQQEKIVAEFEEEILSSVVQDNDSLAEDLSKSAANVYIQGQQQSAQSLVNSPVFEKLAQKEDPDVQAFVVATNALVEQIYSDEYRQQVEEQFRENAEDKIREQDISGSFNRIKQSMPLLVLIEENYWLIAGFIVASLYLFASSVIIKPLAGLYGFLLGLFVQNLEKQ